MYCLTMSQKKVCVGSIEDVRHDHTCFVSSCRLKNKVNDLIDTANDWSKRLKRSHHENLHVKGKGKLVVIVLLFWRQHFLEFLRN